MFETEDLVCRKNEKHVILTLLEVARRGAKIGMLAPMLVQFEQEIDQEIARYLLFHRRKKLVDDAAGSLLCSDVILKAEKEKGEEERHKKWQVVKFLLPYIRTIGRLASCDRNEWLRGQLNTDTNRDQDHFSSDALAVWAQKRVE